MLNMTEKINFIIPIIISLLALLFSGYQLYISNKQFLFDKRLNIYIFYENFLIHQKDATKYFNEKPDDFCEYNMIIACLTNDSKLETMCNGWESIEPLLDNENQKNFLTKLEEIKTYGKESYFIFNKFGKELCQYFYKYADLLYKTYQYRICMKHIDKIHMTLEDAKNEQQELHQELIQLYKDLCTISKTIDSSKLEKEILFIKKGK